MKLLTLKETSEYLQISIMTLYRLIKKGELPGLKVGGQYRVIQEKLDQKLGSL